MSLDYPARRLDDIVEAGLWLMREAVEAAIEKHGKLDFLPPAIIKTLTFPGMAPIQADPGATADYASFTLKPNVFLNNQIIDQWPHVFNNEYKTAQRLKNRQLSDQVEQLLK